jgi:hypothetical protein
VSLAEERVARLMSFLVIFCGTIYVMVWLDQGAYILVTNYKVGMSMEVLTLINRA